MWKLWAIVVLGFLFIMAPFLGLTTFIFKAFMALGGLAFVILGFWMLSEEKLKKERKIESSHEPR